MFFQSPKVPQITVKDLKIQVDQNNQIKLLDVRTSAEFAKGKIANSTNIPLDEIAQKIETVFPNKSDTIYIYCLSGSRSAIAVSTMIQMGYKNTLDVANGLLAWRASGYPVT